jgi:hypothetical protein
LNGPAGVATGSSAADQFDKPRPHHGTRLRALLRLARASSDTEHMHSAVPSSLFRRLPVRRQVMSSVSLVVAAVSDNAAALATDSIHVDLRTGIVSTDYRKHIQFGVRAAAFVGVSDSDGVEVSAWLATALGRAARLADIADEF